MLDKFRTNRQRRPKPTKLEEIPLLDVFAAATAAKKLLTPVGKGLPDWKKHLGGAFHSGRERFSDAYATVARFAALQKEAFEDHLAEKKSRNQTSGKKPSSSHPKA